VVDVQVSSGKLTKKKRVETPFPAPFLPGARVVEGTFAPVKMNDERRMLRLYAVPLKATVEVRGRLRYRAFKPSRAKISYEGEVDVCETPWGEVVIA
jgi:hypothetical protein